MVKINPTHLASQEVGKLKIIMEPIPFSNMRIWRFINLNRQFPGNQNGTITELLAYTISSKIIQRCNYVADIHAGDANEDLHPYVAIYDYGTQTAKAKQMALALDFPWIIISENAPKPGMPTLYCTAETVSKDIPVVGIEYGKDVYKRQLQR